MIMSSGDLIWPDKTPINVINKWQRASVANKTQLCNTSQTVTHTDPSYYLYLLMQFIFHSH